MDTFLQISTAILCMISTFWRICVELSGHFIANVSSVKLKFHQPGEERPMWYLLNSHAAKSEKEKPKQVYNLKKTRYLVEALASIRDIGPIPTSITHTLKKERSMPKKSPKGMTFIER